MKITFVNYKKEFPTMRCKYPMFSVNRYWGGKILNLGFLHFCIVIDRRKNWVKDMITGKIE